MPSKYEKIIVETKLELNRKDAPYSNGYKQICLSTLNNLINVIESFDKSAPHLMKYENDVIGFYWRNDIEYLSIIVDEDHEHSMVYSCNEDFKTKLWDGNKETFPKEILELLWLD